MMTLNDPFSVCYYYTTNNCNHPARAGWFFYCQKREVVGVAGKLTCPRKYCQWRRCGMCLWVRCPYLEPDAKDGERSGEG